MLQNLLSGVLRRGTGGTSRRSSSYGGGTPTTGTGGYGGRGDVGGQIGAQVGRSLMGRLRRR